MMTSSIGSKAIAKIQKFRSRRGISFIEVMVTLAILTGGLVAIYRAFFLSLDYTTHLTNRLYANVFLNNRLAELQQQYQATGEVLMKFDEDIKKALVNNREINFTLRTTLKSAENLNQVLWVSLILSWSEQNHPVSLMKSGYISRF